MCPDMTGEWTDVSVGVLEGKPDWNTLVIRTPAGGDLVKRAIKGKYIETQKMPAQNLEHLMTASMNKKRRAFAEAEKQGILNTEDETKRACMRVRPAVLQRIMG